MFDPNSPLDVELGLAMDAVFEIIKESPENPFTDDQLRMAVVSTNLKALCNVLLLAVDNPDGIQINLTQIILGILGTADWLSKDLPSLEEEFQKNLKNRLTDGG